MQKALHTFSHFILKIHEKILVFFLLYKWGNWDLKRLTTLLKVTVLIKNKIHTSHMDPKPSLSKKGHRKMGSPHFTDDKTEVWLRPHSWGVAASTPYWFLKAHLDRPSLSLAPGILACHKHWWRPTFRPFKPMAAQCSPLLSLAQHSGLHLISSQLKHPSGLPRWNWKAQLWNKAAGEDAVNAALSFAGVQRAVLTACFGGFTPRQAGRHSGHTQLDWNMWGFLWHH